MPLEKLLQQKPELLDAPGRLLYRAYAIALVDLLRHAPEGPARLARFIDGLRSASNDPMADFETIFLEFSRSVAARKEYGKGKSPGSPQSSRINC